MEYPTLIAGQKARFAVHLTDLRAFKPIATGHVTVRLKRGGNDAQTFLTPAPSKAGIFGIDVQPKAAATYSMVVEVNSAEFRDEHHLGEVRVYENAAQAPGAEQKPAEETIAFLKEQQWAIDFATEAVSERFLRDSLEVPGEIRPRTGGEAEVTSPISGRLSASSRISALGTAIAKGQILALIIPRTSKTTQRATLEAAVTEASAALDLARKGRERADDLLANGAIALKWAEQARAAEATAQARLKAAQALLTQYENTQRAGGEIPSENLFAVRSPLSGVIAESHATPGQNVEEGETMFKVIAVDIVYVVANVPEIQAPRLPAFTGAEVKVPGTGLSIRAGRLVSMGQVIDPASRTLRVIYEVTNRGKLLAIGQAVSVRLLSSNVNKKPAVPESAVIDDGGRPVVFVQVGGESFSRRPVRLGTREGNYVQVLEGVEPGERVVKQGAYLIRLSTLSSQIPAHGHVH